MALHSPRLNKAGFLLEQSLEALEQATSQRNGVQQQIERSWRQIDATMKAMARNQDWAHHSNFRKQHTAHAALQKKLQKAQAICSSAAKDFRSARMTYDDARAALSAQMARVTTEVEDLQRAHGGAARSLVHTLGRLIPDNPENDAIQSYDVKEGAYDYIPFDIPSLLSLLVRLDQLLAEDKDYAHPSKRYRPVSFLEVGCGPGRNLVITRESKLISLSGVSGFDINPVQVALGQQAYGLSQDLHVADAMTFDYSAFDVVYSFRPFSDLDMLAQLEAHIAGSMRKSAYLLAPLSYDLSLHHALVPVLSAPDIWKKVT